MDLSRDEHGRSGAVEEVAMFNGSDLMWRGLLWPGLGTGQGVGEKN